MPRSHRPPLRWWPRTKAQAVLAQSARLQLTAMRPDDALAYADSLSDPDVREWQGYDDEVVNRNVRHFVPSLSIQFRGLPTQLAVRDAETGTWLGYYGLTQDSMDLLGDTVFLGWWLADAARGRGLGHESLQLVLRWLHDEAMVGTVRMGTRSDNVRALAMITRTGARLQDEHPTLLPNGTAPLGKWFVHEL